MSRDEYDDEDFDYGSLSEDHQRDFLYDLIGFTHVEIDSEARDLFWSVMYDDELSVGQRLDLYDQLTVYIQDNYGIDFNEIWDWEAFREWYD